MQEDDGIVYRKATIADVGILAALRVKFLNEIFDYDNHPEESNLIEELMTFYNESINNDTSVSWLAEIKGDIVATSTLVVWQAPMTYAGLGKKGRRGYILNMYTLEKYRKHGLATTLFNKLMVEAKNLNLEYVSLHATEDGMNMYKKEGFVEGALPELKFKL